MNPIANLGGQDSNSSTDRRVELSNVCAGEVVGNGWNRGGGTS